MCAYAGLEINDVRVQGAERLKLKESGFFPFGQYPVLVIGDKTIGLSSAIIRTLAKLAGKDVRAFHVVQNIFSTGPFH